jgi:hypothetical protein
MILIFSERQSWIDKRLAFKDSTNNITTLALSISMLKKIWKPDTFFFNGKQVIFSMKNLSGHLNEKRAKYQFLDVLTIVY